MSFIQLTVLKNSNLSGDTEVVYVNANSIELIRPAPGRASDRTVVFIGQENALLVPFSPEKVVELIEDQTPQLTACQSLIAESILPETAK